MKQLIISVFAVIGALAILAGAVHLWTNRPNRPAVNVNDRVITYRELEQRGQMLLEDAVKNEHLVVPEERKADAMRHYMKKAAKMQILKEVLLSAAIAKGTKVTAEDEKAELAKCEEKLTKFKHMTMTDYFTNGPLPEVVKRQDFREGVLVTKFVEAELKDKIQPKLDSASIEKKLAELIDAEKKRVKAGGKPKGRINRKTAIDALKVDAYNRAFRALFRKLYVETRVTCPLFPELGELNNVSPERPEDVDSVPKKGQK